MNNHFLPFTYFFLASPSRSPPMLPIIFCISGLLLISFIMFMRLPAPPSCAIILGSIIDCSLPRNWLGLRIMFTLSLPLPRLVWPTLPISTFSFLCSSRRIFTSYMRVPEPLAMRLSRDYSVMGASLSSSSGVMESMIQMNRLILWMDSFSLSLLMRLVPAPGSRERKELREPNLRIDSNCPLRSLMVNSPFFTFSSSFCWSFTDTASFTLSISCLMSPSPNSRLMKERASKVYRFSKCSPSPMKMMGLLVAATAERAPPPLEWPSILVMMTEPTLTALRKASAWAQHCWPMELSITKMMLSGCTAFSTCFISSNSSVSCLCLPDVSTMMISIPSSLNSATPSSAIVTGSVSMQLPQKGTRILAAFCLSWSKAPALKVSAQTMATRHPFFLQQQATLLHVVVLPLPWRPTNMMMLVLPLLGSYGFLSTSSKEVSSLTTADLIKTRRLPPSCSSVLNLFMMFSLSFMTYRTSMSLPRSALHISLRHSFMAYSLMTVVLLNFCSAEVILRPSSASTIPIQQLLYAPYVHTPIPRPLRNTDRVQGGEKDGIRTGQVGSIWVKEEGMSRYASYSFIFDIVASWVYESQSGLQQSLGFLDGCNYLVSLLLPVEGVVFL